MYVDTLSSRHNFMILTLCFYPGSMSTATTQSLSYDPEGDAYDSEWVYWGTVIETCGTGSEQTVAGGITCEGSLCGGASDSQPHCTGPVKSYANVCSRTPQYIDGKPQIAFAQRKLALIFLFFGA